MKPTQTLSLRFGVVFYDDRIIIPKTRHITILKHFHKRHPAINKMTSAAELH